MKFTGKKMREFVTIKPPGFENSKDLNAWIELGIEHAEMKLKQKNDCK